MIPCLNTPAHGLHAQKTVAPESGGAGKSGACRAGQSLGECGFEAKRQSARVKMQHTYLRVCAGARVRGDVNRSGGSGVSIIISIYPLNRDGYVEGCPPEKRQFAARTARVNKIRGRYSNYRKFPVFQVSRFKKSGVQWVRG